MKRLLKGIIWLWENHREILQGGQMVLFKAWPHGPCNLQVSSNSAFLALMVLSSQGFENETTSGPQFHHE